MQTLIDKHILVGVTGGIAAYKSAELVRRLREQGAQVQVVMTPAAKEFISQITLQALSGNAVRGELWDAEAEAAMGHIELARWADIILVAPASANFLARLAHGFADDLLSTLCLASSAPVLVAPAMNQRMWLNPATQSNIQLLRARDIVFIGPTAGAQACGDIGPGRMVEVIEIIDYLAQINVPQTLSGKNILITAGPTRENIDAVRYLSNRSSGKMGFSLAEAAQAAGAQVTLISGPVHLKTPALVERIDVTTAEQMYAEVLKRVQGSDIFIATAAVADYYMAQPATQKLKKNTEELNLTLSRTKDILAAVTQLSQPPFTVGFAAETEQVLDYARAKLKQKNLDMIVANQVGEAQGFDVDENAVTVITADKQSALACAPKAEIARQLIELIAQQFSKTVK